MGLTVHFEVLNQLGTPMMYSATLANRPAAGITGRIFFRTDSPYGIFRDTGNAWDQISGASTFSGSLATGQVAFGSALNTIAGNNNLVWDNVNGRLGIGNSGPSGTLSVGTSGLPYTIRLGGADQQDSRIYFGRQANVSINVANSGGRSIFFSKGYDAGLMNLFADTGNLVIQNGGTFVDGGQRLQVNGDAFISTRLNVGTNSTGIAIINARQPDDSYATNALQLTNGNGTFNVSIAGDQSRITGSNRIRWGSNLFFESNIAISTTGLLARSANGISAMFIGENNTVTGTRVSNVTLGSTQIFSLPGFNFFNSGNQNWRVGYANNTIARENGQITSIGMIGSYYNNTMTAPTNNSYLCGMLINPVFEDNTFTGNTKVAFGIVNNVGYSIYQEGGSSLNYLAGTLGIKTTSPYAPSTFSLDVNGGLLVKNTAGTTAQITLINADPSLGGNNGFLVQSVGGTSGSSYVDLQGYYGTSITGSTALRLNPAGGPVIINSTTNSGEQIQITGTIRVNGQTSGTAGGNSGQHLIINCDGTTYKIALLNP